MAKRSAKNKPKRVGLRLQVRMPGVNPTHTASGARISRQVKILRARIVNPTITASGATVRIDRAAATFGKRG